MSTKLLNGRTSTWKRHLIHPKTKIEEDRYGRWAPALCGVYVVDVTDKPMDLPSDLCRTCAKIAKGIEDGV